MNADINIVEINQKANELNKSFFDSISNISYYLN